MTENPTILSLNELQVDLNPDVYDHLKSSYKAHSCHSSSSSDNNDNDSETASEHLDRILRAMKLPPRTSVCRVNQILSNKEEVCGGLTEEMNDWIARYGAQEHLSCSISVHPLFDDVVTIDIQPITAASAASKEDVEESSLADCKIPPKHDFKSMLFTGWSKRQEKGWPMTHKVVICDRFCGEAVLRGSDIFVRGVLCADRGIVEGDTVAVYADLGPNCKSAAPSVPRGLLLERYKGRCVFLGLGKAACNRAEFFNLFHGVALYMSPLACDRAGPTLPPLSGVLTTEKLANFKVFVQNLPSIVVGHALAPQKGDMILDMCSAPGGKTSHLASLVRNKATIVACDKSRKKMVAARSLFERMGASCITPLALDATHCVEKGSDRWKSVLEVLALATPHKQDGLLTVKRFFPESFDRILLDPPCSALGIRPKLQVAQTLQDLQASAKYQRKFVASCVVLLKPGGVMTYSTCTIHGMENEGMVRFILDEYRMIELVPMSIPLGQPGLQGFGLNEYERQCVRRFEPTETNDTIGFFVAKFQKKKIKASNGNM